MGSHSGFILRNSTFYLLRGGPESQQREWGSTRIQLRPWGYIHEVGTGTIMGYIFGNDMRVWLGLITSREATSPQGHRVR